MELGRDVGERHNLHRIHYQLNSLQKHYIANYGHPHTNPPPAEDQ
jgi:hypothetical protein